LYTLRGIVRNPTGTAGGLLFCLGFTLVAGNAIYSQPQVHPDPFWNTTDTVVTESLRETVQAEAPVGTGPDTGSITRSVLTQTISLKNIPVPTMKPMPHANAAGHSELVRETQEALSGLGLYDGKIDGILGSGTTDAIIAFQENSNILPNGNASFELLNSIRAASAATQRIANAQPVQPQQVVALPSVAPTSSGLSLTTASPSAFDRDMVVRIQSGLKERFGEAEIDVDGVFGDQTRNALKRFQSFFDLDPTGEIDARTLEKLLSAGVIQAI
jgi:peptidoglycan hydrolase-like protein with peptidoglycan-binding domain